MLNFIVKSLTASFLLDCLQFHDFTNVFLCASYSFQIGK